MTVRMLHDEAMDLLDRSIIARSRGQDTEEQALLLAALDKESRAAQAFALDFGAEPTRGVLFRSAATLALRVGDLRRSEQLAHMGLTGSPPTEIAAELRRVLDEATFHLHLATEGIELTDTGIRLVLAGPEVAPGQVAVDELIPRFEAMDRMIRRTAEEAIGRPFKESGRPAGDVAKFALYIEELEAASFAVMISVGSPVQPHLPGFSTSADLLQKMMARLRLISEGNRQALEEDIKELPYLRSFVGLARQLAPDGARVTSVGLTIRRHGVLEEVALRRLSSDVVYDPIPEKAPEKKERIIVGELRYASSIKGNTIRIVDSQGRFHTVDVPEGMLNDIVKPLWDATVVARCTTGPRSGVFELIDIRSAESDD